MSRKLFSGVSERSDWPSICAKVSPNDRTSCRTVRKSLRAFGQAVELCESLSKRSDKPSNCAKVSPSVRTGRRTVRKSLQALGQSGGMSDGFSERWDSPAECPTARNSSIQSLRLAAGDFILRRSILHIVQSPPAHDRHAPTPDNIPDREKYGPQPHNGSGEPN